MEEVNILIHIMCVKNPGKCGYVSALECRGHIKELSGGIRLTTTNRAALTAACVALEALRKPCKVSVRGNNAYLVDTINKGWQRNKNQDLWFRLDNAMEQHEVTFFFGDSDGNVSSKYDDMAYNAADNATDVDEYYEHKNGHKNIKVFTTYFAKLHKLPSGIVPVAICGKVPEDYKGLQYKSLAPKYWFFKKYKEDNDESFYTDAYIREVLAYLNRRTVLTDLAVLSGGKDVALVCYERADKFCHRHLVASWLGDDVSEYAY